MEGWNEREWNARRRTDAEEEGNRGREEDGGINEPALGGRVSQVVTWGSGGVRGAGEERTEREGEIASAR